MGRSRTYLSALFLAIGGFLFGYDSGIITSTISLPLFKEYFTNPSDTMTGGIVSAFQGGAVGGTIWNMLFANQLGRKKSILLGSLVSCLGCALQAGSVNIGMLICGRFIAGWAVGMLTSTIPMYASELSEPSHRGILSGLLQWMLSWGFLVAQWLGYGCSFVDSHFQWRFPLAFQTIPGIILVLGVGLLTESPRWLMEKDRFDEARQVLNKLRQGSTSEENIELEYQEIRDVIAADRANMEVSWKTILTKPSWRRRLILGCGVQIFGPLSGINVINYYGPRIYALLGISNQTSLKIIGISGALSIVYCTIGLLLLDRVGRVKPLWISALGLAAALLINAALAGHIDGAGPNQLRAMVAMNFVFSLFYIPLGIISWVYPAEIFPVEVRALGNAITTFANWTLNLCISQASTTALTNMGFRYFYIWFAFNLLAAVCYFFFFPETKGRTLEQMDVVFGDQLVPHALEDPDGAHAVMEKQAVVTMEHA